MQDFVKDNTIQIHHGELVVDAEPEEEFHDVNDKNDHAYMNACIYDINDEMGAHEQDCSAWMVYDVSLRTMAMAIVRVGTCQ